MNQRKQKPRLTLIIIKKIYISRLALDNIILNLFLEQIGLKDHVFKY